MIFILGCWKHFKSLSSRLQYLSKITFFNQNFKLVHKKINDLMSKQAKFRIISVLTLFIEEMSMYCSVFLFRHQHITDLERF